MHKKIYLLIIIFILPILMGSLLFYFHDYFNMKTINHGVLVNPPLVTNQYDKKWQIALAPQNCCDAACENRMFNLHQLRRALGKEGKRISLALIMDSTCSIKEMHDFQKRQFNPSQKMQLQKVLADNHDKEPSINNKIYLIDPLGNLFMYYPASVNFMDILKDLKRVLEVSQIG